MTRKWTKKNIQNKKKNKNWIIKTSECIRNEERETSALEGNQVNCITFVDVYKFVVLLLHPSSSAIHIKFSSLLLPFVLNITCFKCVHLNWIAQQCIHNNNKEQLSENDDSMRHRNGKNQTLRKKNVLINNRVRRITINVIHGTKTLLSLLYTFLDDKNQLTSRWSSLFFSSCERF